MEISPITPPIPVEGPAAPAMLTASARQDRTIRMASTPGLKALETLGVQVTLHPYDYDPNADAVGLAAAAALGLDPGRTLKCLMVEVDGKPACCVIPSDRQLSMKKVAAAFGAKSAAMMPPRQGRTTDRLQGGRDFPLRPEKARADRDRGQRLRL